ncbi:Uncharacterized membrane protein YbhN, UPF0104 family [Pseudonocardia thermophila]|uniref:Uncharacterized membrane protein YbhN, UPF0104 family n=1 Tax=Pseudonocardia thermophila TaxID=1848 RepID=A0A1M6WUB5_PSETH|nr:lysylphosphatidylglycerol synthase transmembrane domain-containing protein [Pseudonocardia thermophila]SHK97313.1 Uncharacterized membrane protein YbhN, UPF0104 family [Pseudonocardia thermophila]
MHRSLLRLLPAAAALAVLAALALHLGTDEVLATIAALDAGVLAAAVGIGFVSTTASATRWWLIARSAGLRLSLRRAVADYYRAQLANTVLPAGVLGDVHRAVDHGRRSGDLGGGVRAVMLDRMAGLVVLVLVAVGVLAAQPRLLPVLADLVLPSAAVGPVLGGLAAAAVLLLIVFRRRLLPLVRDLRRMATMRVWPGVVLLSGVAIAGYLATFVLAARAAGVTAPVAELLPALLLSLLVMGLPINVGGFGPREAVAAVAFAAQGLGAAAGFATSVGYGVLCLVACLPGLLTLVRRLRPVPPLDLPAPSCGLASPRPDHASSPRRIAAATADARSETSSRS